MILPLDTLYVSGVMQFLCLHEITLTFLLVTDFFFLSVTALYHKTHPAYPSYLYLMAPISLVILNPLGFILMELGRSESSLSESSTTDAPEMRAPGSSGHQARFKMIWQVMRGIILNPVVFMTALGIIGNLVFKHNPPAFLAGILQVCDKYKFIRDWAVLHFLPMNFFLFCRCLAQPSPPLPFFSLGHGWLGECRNFKELHSLCQAYLLLSNCKVLFTS